MAAGVTEGEIENVELAAPSEVSAASTAELVGIASAPVGRVVAVASDERAAALESSEVLAIRSWPSLLTVTAIEVVEDFDDDVLDLKVVDEVVFVVDEVVVLVTDDDVIEDKVEDLEVVDEVVVPDDLVDDEDSDKVEEVVILDDLVEDEDEDDAEVAEVVALEDLLDDEDEDDVEIEVLVEEDDDDVDVDLVEVDAALEVELEDALLAPY